ncbi:MAG: site-2 protease family protein [Acidilobaceae archaeon]
MRLVMFLVALLAFWILLLVFSKTKKFERLEVKPFLLIYKIGKSIERKRGTFFDFLGSISWIGLPVLFVSALFFYFIIGDAVYYRYFSPEPPQDEIPRGIVPLLPGVTIPLDINLVLALFSIGLAVLVHEVGHALSAASLGLRVKDSGMILLAFIPAAFVELDEESFRRASWSVKTRVLSAGVTSNIVLAFLALALLLSAPIPQPDGVMIESVELGSVAEKAGLAPGDVVRYVNGLEVKSVADFRKVLEELGVFDESVETSFEIAIVREGKVLVLSITKPVGEDRLGVTLSNVYSGMNNVLLALIITLRTLFVINLALALINAAPLIIPSPWGNLMTDGAQVIKETLTPLLGERLSGVTLSALGLATLLLTLSVITLEPLRFVP